MNLLMAATPIAMLQCSHPFSATALVLEWHVLGMFVPSFFTGWLIRRFGALPVMAVGVLLNAVCIAVALSGVELMQFLVALVTLGVGWNFLFIGGTTLLTEAYRPEEKTTAQAAMDTTMLATMTLTSLGSGALVTTQGWTWLNLGSIVPLAAGAALVWLALQRRAACRAVSQVLPMIAMTLPPLPPLPPSPPPPPPPPRAEPATRSKRNSRHSIGPFHIGTRRASFSRIALGSFMSGLSTQAVQPADSGVGASSARRARRRSRSACHGLRADSRAAAPALPPTSMRSP